MTDDFAHTPLHDEEPPLDGALAEAAARYNTAPPVVPREAMWAAIRAARSAPVAAPQHTVASPAASPALEVVRTTRRTLPRSWRAPAGFAAAAAAIAAVVLLRGPAVPVPAVAAHTSADSVTSATAWQVASTDHFGAAETMLATLATSDPATSDRQLTAWSRDLLESTRLLMDSPAGRDPRRRALLEDLELVLVQLVESGPAMRAEDRNAMDDLLSRSTLLLTRIRTTIPAGAPASQH